MTKWVVQFIEENKEKWDRMRKQKREDMKKEKEKEDWENKTKEEKIKLLKEEKERKKEKLKTNKETRLEEAIKLKEMWQRRGNTDNIEEDDEKESGEEVGNEDEGDGNGEDGEQGRLLTTIVGDNDHMAQASGHPRHNWEPPASNSLTKSPKGGILVGGPKNELGVWRQIKFFL